MDSKTHIFLKKHYKFFVLLTCILTIITIQIRNHIVQQRQITAFREEMLEQFVLQTELISETLQDIKDEIADGTTKIGNQIAWTNVNIQRTERVYAEILGELKKRTLDSLYTEDVLVAKEKEANTLFKEGKYTMASANYVVVAEAQPDNKDARFYYLYSLFLSNKLERSNYRRIKEGFQTLERNGYHRTEIRDVLAFIELEENGLGAEVSR